jgi:hypothetical protein
MYAVCIAKCINRIICKLNNQAVSRRLPTAAVRVRSQVRSCGICGKQSDTVGRFSPSTSVSLLVLISPNAPHSSVIQGWYNRPISVEVPNGLALTRPHEIKRKEEVLGRTNLLLFFIRHRPHIKRRLQQFFYCCVCTRYLDNVSTEPLLSNDRGIITELLLINDRAIFTEPLPSNDRGIHIETHTDGRHFLIRPL